MSLFQKWLLWGSSVATAVTGVVYAWMKYLMEPSEPWAVINHPWQPWLLKAHILVAPVLVFAFGLIAVDHVWKHYRCRVPMGRRSGIMTALFFVPMVASGYLIQAVTHAGWLKAMVVAHLVTSAVYVVGLVLHQKVFRRRPRSRKPTGREEPREEGVEEARAAPLRRVSKSLRGRDVSKQKSGSRN